MARSIGQINFGEIYPLYQKKIEKKNRNREELDDILSWLTGLTVKEIHTLSNQDLTLQEFFKQVTLNPQGQEITGVICGIKVEEIEDRLTQKIRYMDKIVDELSKGKDTEKIKRS